MSKQTEVRTMAYTVKETIYRVVALPSANSLRFNPDAKPVYAWFGALTLAKECMMICRSRKVYGRVFIEKDVAA